MPIFGTDEELAEAFGDDALNLLALDFSTGDDWMIV
jgi:hypothetical protein